MYPIKPPHSTVHYRSLVSAIVLAIFVFGVFGLAAGQSGRRLPNEGVKNPSPPSDPNPAPPEPSKPKEQTPLVVTSHLADLIYSSDILNDNAMEGLLERLKQAAGFAVTPVPQMDRKQASDRAKSMDKGYVVWVQLETSMDQVEGVGPDTTSQLYVSYVIYKPKDGKILSQGHVYQQPYATSTGPLPPAAGDINQIQYRMRLAGRETADRVLKVLGVTPLGRTN